jgi:hypothetical protein
MNLKKHFSILNDQVAAAKERLKQTIKGLPSSSDDIKLITPNCGIVSFSTIAKHKGILSPGYYLSHETKAKLIKLIDSKQSIETTMTAIEEILAHGGIKGDSKIAPNVLQALKEAWDDKGIQSNTPATTEEEKTS